MSLVALCFSRHMKEPSHGLCTLANMSRNFMVVHLCSACFAAASSGRCLLDSLRVVRDFFKLESFLRDSEPNTAASSVSTDALSCATVDPSTAHRSSGSNGIVDNLPASPLQTLLALSDVFPGEEPQVFALDQFCKLLDEALKTQEAPFAESSVQQEQVGKSADLTSDAAAAHQSAASASTETRAEGPGACSCPMDEALVCLDTDGSGAVEFDELVAASMTRVDFLEREPTCRQVPMYD